jgi:hypothetical protein
MSLGGVNPRPNTCRGTIVSAAPVTAALLRNSRREIAFFSPISISLATATLSSLQRQRATLNCLLSTAIVARL